MDKFNEKINKCNKKKINKLITCFKKNQTKNNLWQYYTFL